MLASLVCLREFCHCLFIPLGTILCALHQTQWQEVPADIWWWALPSSGGIPWIAGERESAPGRVCLPPGLWEVSSQVRIECTQNYDDTAVMLGHLQTSIKWTEKSRKLHIWETSPKSTGSLRLKIIDPRREFRHFDGSAMRNMDLESYVEPCCNTYFPLCS